MSQLLLVQLFNDDFGNIILDEINEPAGLDAFKLTNKRDKKADGFLYEFSVNLDFVKQGREWIKNIFESKGTDAVITIVIYAYDPNAYKYNIVEYQGQLQLDNYTIDETKVTTNVEPVGFQRKFLNLKKRDVNLDSVESRNGTFIGTAPSIILPLAPKTIQKKAVHTSFDGAPWTESSFYGGDTSGFINTIRIGTETSATDFKNTFLETLVTILVVEKYSKSRVSIP